MSDSDATRAYETFLKCREQDLNHTVSRSNVCIGVQAALLAFGARPMLMFSTPVTLAEKAVGFAIALAGLVLSVIALRVVRGVHFWVSYWEWRLAEIEEHVIPEVEVFRNYPCRSNKERLLELSQLPNPLIYVSSRRAMLAMFYSFVVIWIGLLIVMTVR